MQRDTSDWHIARANELAKQIDAAETQPVELIAEWEQCCDWLRRYAPHVHPLDAYVICPANW